MLNTGVPRVARLERQALDALATGGPGGACSSAPGLVTIAAGGLLDLLGLGDGSGQSSAGSDDPASEVEAQVAGQRVTSGDSESSDAATIQFPLGLPAASAADLAWLFVVVMTLFFAAGVWKELFSRRTAQHR
jgi:hypothetical protein